MRRCADSTASKVGRYLGSAPDTQPYGPLLTVSTTGTTTALPSFSFSFSPLARLLPRQRFISIITISQSFSRPAGVRCHYLLVFATSSVFVESAILPGYACASSPSPLPILVRQSVVPSCEPRCRLSPRLQTLARVTLLLLQLPSLPTPSQDHNL